MTAALLALALLLLALAARAWVSRRASLAREAERRALLAAGVHPLEVHWSYTQLPTTECPRCGQRTYADTHGEPLAHACEGAP